MLRLLDQYYDVIPDDEDHFQFKVRSRSHPLTWHTVALREEDDQEVGGYHWNGWCDCDAFTFKFGSNLRKDGLVSDSRTRCYHIKRARAYYLDVMLPKISKSMADNK